MNNDLAAMGHSSTFVPKHDRDAIVRYIEHGIIPGSFLQAVICNDLREAFGQADYINTTALPTIVAWFYSHAPALCWGSRERMLAWHRLKQEPSQSETAS